jgi:predicted Zn-ribbon and HTH transcriptional regulator
MRLSELIKIMSEKEGTFTDKDGKICIVRCPKCKLENYALAVMSGICVWCGFEANEGKQEGINDD